MNAQEALAIVFSERLRNLSSLTEASKPLSKYSSSKGFAKGWILPDKKFVSIPGWHLDYLLDNADQLKKKFGVDFSHLTRDDGEQKVRLYALNHGFIRVNYEHNTGTLTIEANSKFWDKRAKDTVFMIVADNEDSVDNMSTALVDAKGNVVNNKFARLFGYDGREKFDHLPLVTDSERNSVLRSVLVEYLDGFPTAAYYPARVVAELKTKKKKPKKKKDNA